MKRWWICLLLVCLVGCAQPNAPTFDLTTTPQALLEADLFDQELDTLPSTKAQSYFALDTAPTAASVYTSLEGGYEVLALLEYADEASAQAAIAQLEDFVAAQIATETQVQYLPADLPKLENPLIEVRGSVVLLLVCADMTQAEEILG